MEVPKPADSPRAVPELSGLRISRESEGPRRPIGWLILGSILAVVLALGAYFAASSYLGAITVEKTTASLVTQGQALTLLTVSGYVEAETRADLSPKITSRITELRVTEGTRVKKGDVIARLDHTDLDAQLADAHAGWENADAELKRQRALFDPVVLDHHDDNSPLHAAEAQGHVPGPGVLSDVDQHLADHPVGERLDVDRIPADPRAHLHGGAGVALQGGREVADRGAQAGGLEQLWAQLKREPPRPLEGLFTLTVKGAVARDISQPCA